MKTFAVASLIALASVASAQLDNIPSCALTCFLTPLGSDGCTDLTDFACHCKKGTELLAQVQPCVQKACSAADQATTISAVETTCKAAGVPIEIPDTTSAASSVASAVASSASAVISDASSAVESAASSLSSAIASAISSATATHSANGTTTATGTVTGSVAASSSAAPFTGAAAQATQAAGLLGAAALALLAL